MEISTPVAASIAIAGIAAVLLALTMGVFGSKNQFPVEGKTILVTGASDGMGRSAVRQLAAKGANVVIVARNVARLEEVITEMKAAAKNPSTQRFHYITADVTKHDYAKGVVDAAKAWNSGVAPDSVWCVAGMSTPGIWVDTDMSSLRSQMDVNFWGTAEMAHAILREWLSPDQPPNPAAEPKHLVFTSSTLVFVPIVGYGPYTPAKSALRGLADTLAQELLLYRPHQPVSVHVVYAGGIDSPGFARENLLKPEITKVLEEGDVVQSPDEVASKAIGGLEAGHYQITVAFLGHLMRWSSPGGSPRQNWIVDGFMTSVLQLAWIFILPDMLGKIKNFGKKHGHPSTYKKGTTA